MAGPRRYQPIEPASRRKTGVSLSPEPIAKQDTLDALDPVSRSIIPTRLAKLKRYDRKQLALDTTQLTGRITTWLLEGDRLETLLSETKLKDALIALGVATDKMLLLEGQPTQIIGQPQQAKLDQLGQALATALHQRGLNQQVQLTERTATIELKP